MKKKKNSGVCQICLRGIGKKEDYVRLTQYNEGNEISTAYYHTECFRERFMNFKKIQEDANKILGMASPLLQKAQGQGVF